MKMTTPRCDRTDELDRAGDCDFGQNEGEQSITSGSGNRINQIQVLDFASPENQCNR